MSSPRNSPELSTLHGRYSDSRQSLDYSDKHQHVSNAVGAGGHGLAQSIHDEFLICKICLDGYVRPKSLECMHTFCEDCIEKHIQAESTYKKYSDYRDFTCPLCRKRTQLPIGGVRKLPENALLSRLLELVGRQRPSTYPFCDICKKASEHPVAARCLDCAKMLCSSCVTIHRATRVTQDHAIFSSEVEREVLCHDHPDETVRFYCVPCERCICVLCAFDGDQHREHEIARFGEAADRYKELMQSQVDRCADKMTKLRAQVTSLSRCEEIVNAARKKIVETASGFVMEIRNREKLLLSELTNVFGEDCLEQVTRKAELEARLDSMDNTCRLTESILSGKDLELLLLRKDAQEKLTQLGAAEVKNLPPGVDKVVEFVPGTVDLGQLNDPDRKLSSNLKVITNFVQTSTETTPTGSRRRQESSVQIKNGKQNQKTKNKFRKDKEDTSDSTSSSSEDSDDDDDEQDDDDSDDDDEKEESESSSQSSSSVSDSKKPAKKGARRATSDKSTMTNQVIHEDKAVNTKARSMLSSNSGRRSSVVAVF